MKRILVTGCGGAAAANFVASLRTSGEEFHIVGTDTNRFRLHLADVDARRIMPPSSDPAYIERLNAVIREEGVQMVHPQPDPEVAALSENRESVAARLYLPGREAIRTCQDKMRLVDLLEERNIPHPRARVVSRPRDISDSGLLGDGRKAWIRAIVGAGSRASLPVRSAAQARAWIEYWQDMRGIGYGQFMISEFLPGREFAWQSIWRDGDLVTSQARERIEYMFSNLTPSGQSSSPAVARTVNRDDVNQTATAAVKAAGRRGGATGVFCVDLKENVDGIPCVTEINAGRFFTTSNFFAAAGSNMPLYYTKMAFGEALPDLPQYNPLREDVWWIRNMDMEYKLIEGADQFR